MTILIIEDEELAASRLKRMLLEINSSIQVMGITDSIEATVKWLKSNPEPELIFADIQLADGASFQIFEQVQVKSPVIFTTAYDQYAIQAFKVNSIGYILKPIKKAELEHSLQKFSLLKPVPVTAAIDYNQLANLITQTRQPDYQKRLVIKFGHTLRTVDIADIAYFYTEEKICFACTREGKRWPLDHNLDELEMILDPAQFFRINRQFIVHIKSMESMHSHSKSRIKIVLSPPSATEPLVSSERSAQFKQWLLGK